MTVQELLRQHRGLDAELLLAHVLGKDRAWLLAHGEHICPPAQAGAFVGLLRRRRGGEPVAHLTGNREFYGRTFRVTKDTLVPRPATEMLVTEVLRFLREGRGAVTGADTDIAILSEPLHAATPELILDIGTGTGCIAVTLAKEGWTGALTAVDTSEGALSVAKENARTHGAAITFVLGDGPAFVKTVTRPFLVVSNPPYIPSSITLEKDVQQFEPHEALFAGGRGLDVLLPLASAAAGNPRCTGIVLELRTDQVQEVKQALRSGMLQA